MHSAHTSVDFLVCLWPAFAYACVLFTTDSECWKIDYGYFWSFVMKNRRNNNASCMLHQTCDVQFLQANRFLQNLKLFLWYIHPTFLFSCGLHNGDDVSFILMAVVDQIEFKGTPFWCPWDQWERRECWIRLVLEDWWVVLCCSSKAILIWMIVLVEVNMSMQRGFSRHAWSETKTIWFVFWGLAFVVVTHQCGLDFAFYEWSMEWEWDPQGLRHCSCDFAFYSYINRCLTTWLDILTTWWWFWTNYMWIA